MEQFSGRRYIDLESYKKTGEPKVTPVQSLEHDGLLYLRTGPQTWKVKRIRRNPKVRVAPSDRGGKPVGAWVEGEAHVLEGEEQERMLKVFRKEYGAIGYSMVGLVGRLRGERQMTAVISIKLQPLQAPKTG
jgi:PPOX class probable F420-dependent enzyme